MNETLKHLQLNAYLAQLEANAQRNGDPLDINIAQLIAQSGDSTTLPDGTNEDPISITSEQPVPVQPVFSPEKELIERTGDIGTILLLVLVLDRWLNLRGLVGGAVSYLKAQNQVAQALIADSKKMVERLDQAMSDNNEELVKLRRGIEELGHKVDYFYQRRGDYDPIKLNHSAEREDELRKRRHN